jgi:hypothetical protein
MQTRYAKVGRPKSATATADRLLSIWNSVIVKGVVDLNLQEPVTDPVEVDVETRAAIERGVKDADAGRTVPLEEARRLIPKWISKFESQKPR